MGQILSYESNTENVVPSISNDYDNESSVNKQELIDDKKQEMKERAKEVLDEIILDVVTKKNEEEEKKENEEIDIFVKEFVNDMVEDVVRQLSAEEYESDSDDSIDYDSVDLNKSIKEEVQDELIAANTRIKDLNRIIENLNDEYDNLFLKHIRLDIKYKSLLNKKRK